MTPIYDPNGLRDLAIYLDDLIDGDKPLFESQNALGELAGVSPNTIKGLRKNRDLTPEGFENGSYHKPTIEVLLALAPHLPDPLTGKPFEPTARPCRLEAVARGWEPLHPPKPQAKGRKSKHSAIVLIQSAYAKAPDAFAKSGLSRESLDRLLTGDRPTVEEAFRLAEALNVPMEKLFDLYGVQRNSPLPNGAPIKA